MMLKTAQPAAPIEKPPVIRTYRPPGGKPGASAGPPPPAARNGLHRPKGGLKFWELIFRVAIGGLVVVSLLVAWWSFSVLKQKQKASAELSQRVNKISAQVDALEREFTEAQATEVTNKFNTAKSTLFVGPASLESWWKNVQQEAIPLTLDVKLQTGALIPGLPNESALVLAPATLSFGVQSPAGIELPESPYQRLLRITHALTTAERRADLTELMVDGGTNSTSSAVVNLHLWAGEEGAL